MYGRLYPLLYSTSPRTTYWAALERNLLVSLLSPIGLLFNVLHDGVYPAWRQVKLHHFMCRVNAGFHQYLKGDGPFQLTTRCRDRPCQRVGVSILSWGDLSELPFFELTPPPRVPCLLLVRGHFLILSLVFTLDLIDNQLQITLGSYLLSLDDLANLGHPKKE